MDVAPSHKPKRKPGITGPEGGVNASIAHFVRQKKVRKYVPDEGIEETVRERLFMARTLNKLNQEEAAELLGYKNSSALSKIESGFARIPKDFIVKAATVYGVSCDYLLGLSDEPERDPKTAEQLAVVRSVRNEILAHTQALSEVLLANAGEIQPLESHLKTLMESHNKILDAFENVCRKNKKFVNDVVAGSILQRAIDEGHALALNAKKYMDRRANLVAARTQALSKGREYPLLESLDKEERERL